MRSCSRATRPGPSSSWSTAAGGRRAAASPSWGSSSRRSAKAASTGSPSTIGSGPPRATATPWTTSPWPWTSCAATPRRCAPTRAASSSWARTRAPSSRPSWPPVVPPGLKAAVLVGGTYDVATSAGSAALGPAERGSASYLLVHGSDDTEVPLERGRRALRGLRGGGRRLRALSASRARLIAPRTGGRASGDTSSASWTGWPRRWARPDAYVPVQTRLQKHVVFDEKAGLRLDAWIPEGPRPVPRGDPGPRRGLGSRRSRHLHHAALRAPGPGRLRLVLDRLPADPARCATRPSSTTCAHAIAWVRQQRATPERRSQPARPRRRVGERPDGPAGGRGGSGACRASSPSTACTTSCPW